MRRGFNGKPPATYSPTPTNQTVMPMFAVAVYLGWEIGGWDVVGAYRNTPPTRDVFVRLPRELETEDSMGTVYLMQCMGYGLTDASRAFYDYADAHMMKGNYIKSIFAPTIYSKWQDDDGLIACVHVDDGMYTSNSNHLVRELHEHLRQLFDITVQANLKVYLGLHVERHANGSVTLSSLKHTDDLITAAYPPGSQIPTVTKPMMSWDERYQDMAPPCDMDIWMHLLGMVVYDIRYRFDIVVAVSLLSGRTHKATVRDMEALYYLIAYISYTREWVSPSIRVMAMSARE